jgi:hypothetical protein
VSKGVKSFFIDDRPLDLGLNEAKGASRHPFLDLVKQLSIFVMAPRHSILAPKAFVNGVEHEL